MFLLGQNTGLFAQNINVLEYYIDIDPGYGSGTVVTIPLNTSSISNLSINVPIENTLLDGLHRFHIRAKDENNKWSLVANHSFLKTTFSNPTNLIPNITKLEYYLDDDPGYGSANDVSISPNTSINNLSINMPIQNTLIDGIHRFYIRAKDLNNEWSLVASHPFLKTTFSNPAIAVPNVVMVEYFIDNDPGLGSGINIPLSANPNINGLQAIIDLTGLSSGLHKIYTRVKDVNTNWSIVGNKTIFIENNAILMGNSPVSFCKNTPFNVSFGAYGTFGVGNVFTCQLMSGNSVVATLGSLTSNTSGTISAIIPNSVALGNYDIRVISSLSSPSIFPSLPISVVAICPPPCQSSVILVSTADDYSSGTILKQANAANGSISAANKITGTANVGYQAKSIVLEQGFLAESGVVFKVEVGGCN